MCCSADLQTLPLWDGTRPETVVGKGQLPGISSTTSRGQPQDVYQKEVADTWATQLLLYHRPLGGHDQRQRPLTGAPPREIMVI
jgi:hypothetical protein